MESDSEDPDSVDKTPKAPKDKPTETVPAPSRVTNLGKGKGISSHPLKDWSDDDASHDSNNEDDYQIVKVLFTLCCLHVFIRMILQLTRENRSQPRKSATRNVLARRHPSQR